MLTQKQLAEKLGVSQQAVSYAMSGGGTLKQETRDYIVQEARNLGYRINGASKLFREGRTNSFALIVDGNFHAIPGLMLSGMRRALRPEETHLTLYGAEPEDFSNPENPPRIVRELTVDGFIVFYDGKPSELQQQIAQYRIPSVWINKKQTHFAVYPDDHNISRQLVLELSSRFKGHFLYFGSEFTEDQHYSVEEREAGFLEGLEAAGKAGEAVRAGGNANDHSGEIQGIVSRKRKRPKVVVCYGAEDAQSFYLEASKKGLRVPDDIYIVCFTTRSASIGGYLFPHVLVPINRCGTYSVEMLRKRLESPERKIRSKAVDELIFNEPS